MKIPLIDSVDSVVTRLVKQNTQELKRWGSENRTAPLGNVANLTNDVRRWKRNWDLVEALAKDGRVTVSHPNGGINPNDVMVTLK